MKTYEALTLAADFNIVVLTAISLVVTIIIYLDNKKK